MKIKSRAIVFAIDSNYIVPFEVAFFSLVYRGKIEASVPIFILYEKGRLSVSDQNKVKRFGDCLGYQFRYIDCTNCLPKTLPIKSQDHVSQATFYRLFASSILPDDIDTVLYLDCDIVVTQSLAYLMQVPLNSPVAAVDHFSPSNEFRLWGEKGGCYFNAGVTLFDLKWMRDNNQEEQFSQILKTEFDRIRWWDQDVLNIAFQDNWQRLPIWYNVSSCAMNFLLQDEVYEQACLMHFDGSHKPWDPLNERNYRDIWLDAYQATYGIKFPSLSFSQKLRKICKKGRSHLKGFWMGERNEW